jgi:hypothetical protein
MTPARHKEFAAAVLDPAHAVPSGITSRNAASPARRFAVHRNNVVVGLIDALRDRFPATERIVGKAFFVGMARAFALAHPPDSPLLMFFGDGFPDFIARFAPASELPWLGDVARIECARTHAYHAADAPVSDLSGLLEAKPDALLGARLQLHPSVRLVRSDWAAVTIWRMNDGPEAAVSPVETDCAEDALIARPVFDVTVDSLPPGAAALLDAARTMTFGRAVEAAAVEGDFDLTAALSVLIGRGGFASFSFEGEGR